MVKSRASTRPQKIKAREDLQNRRLDASSEALAKRTLAKPLPYHMFNARSEKGRNDGVATSDAVMISVDLGWDGRRQRLVVEMTNREGRLAWKDFLMGLRERGLQGVEFVVADDHWH